MNSCLTYEPTFRFVEPVEQNATTSDPVLLVAALGLSASSEATPATAGFDPASLHILAKIEELHHEICSLPGRVSGSVPRPSGLFPNASGNVARSPRAANPTSRIHEPYATRQS